MQLFILMVSHFLVNISSRVPLKTQIKFVVGSTSSTGKPTGPGASLSFILFKAPYTSATVTLSAWCSTLPGIHQIVHCFQKVNVDNILSMSGIL